MVLNIDHHPPPLGLQLPWMVSSYCVWGLPAMIPSASQMILGVGVAVWASWPSHFAASASVYSTEQITLLLLVRSRLFPRHRDPALPGW